MENNRGEGGRGAGVKSRGTLASMCVKILYTIMHSRAYTYMYVSSDTYVHVCITCTLTGNYIEHVRI